VEPFSTQIHLNGWLGYEINKGKTMISRMARFTRASKVSLHAIQLRLTSGLKYFPDLYVVPKIQKVQVLWLSTEKASKAWNIARVRAEKSTKAILALFDNQHDIAVRIPATLVQEGLDAVLFWCSQVKLQASGAQFESKAFEGISTADRLLRAVVCGALALAPAELAKSKISLVPIRLVHSILDSYRICLARHCEIEADASVRVAIAQRGQDMLQFLVEKSLKSDGTAVSPVDVKGCNTIMDAWSRAGEPESATRLLHWMEKRRKIPSTEKDLWKDHLPSPNIVTYNTCINAWAQKVKNLSKMQRSHQSRTSQSSESCFEKAALEAAQNAERILLSMKLSSQNCSNEPHRNSYPPNTITYSAVIDAFSHCPPRKNLQSVQRAQELLEEMIQLHSKTSAKVKPNVVTHGAVLHAWAQHSHLDSEAAQNAEELLFRLERLYMQTRDHDLYPTTVCYNIVIDAWARSGRKDSARRAEKLLMKMSTISQHLTPPTLKQPSLKISSHCRIDIQDFEICPNLTSYNSVLNAYAKSSDINAAKRAEALLAAMEREYENGNKSAQPDTVSFTAVIDALAKSSQPDSASKAHSLLLRMITLFERGNKNVRPNAKSFTAVIDAYAKSSSPDRVKQTQELLSLMLHMSKNGPIDMKPNIYTYNAVLNVMACNGEARKAEELLRDLIRLGDIENVQVDTVTYNSCINAWANSKQSISASRAVSLIEEMFKMYNQGNPRVKPDTITYNTALRAIANSKLADCCQLAENLFEDMSKKNVAKDLRTYNALLNAYASSQKYDAPDRAEKTLQEEFFSQKAQGRVLLNVQSFNIVVKAWARSPRRDKSARACELLRKMRTGIFTDIHPDIFTYNTALHACAQDQELDDHAKAEVLRLMLSLMDELFESKTVRADEISFLIAFKGIWRLCGNSGDVEELSKALFNQCCELGIVSTDVLKVVRSTAPGLHADIMAKYSNNKLPYSWTSSIK